jgi:hypothetical protein
MVFLGSAAAALRSAHPYSRRPQAWRARGLAAALLHHGLGRRYFTQHSKRSGAASVVADTTFREEFAVPGRLGLSGDALVFHPQLGEVANLAGAFPDTRIGLNHVGRLVGTRAYPPKLKEEFPRQVASMKALAAHENVDVEVGGLGQAINGLGFEMTSQARNRPRWRRMPRAPMWRAASKPSGRRFNV